MHDGKDLSPLKIARLAGFFYLIIILVGLWSELFVRSALIVPGDAIATAQNVLTSAFQFRLSIAGDAIMAICDVVLAFLLFVLLRPVNGMIALLAMIFRLVQATLIAGNLLNQLAVIQMLENPVSLTSFGTNGVEQLALLTAGLHAKGYDIGLIFFGMNCLLIGYLVFRSNYLPRLIGILIAISGLVYLIGSFLVLLSPETVATFQPAYVICILSETAFCLWLIFRGVHRDGFERASGQKTI